MSKLASAACARAIGGWHLDHGPLFNAIQTPDGCEGAERSGAGEHAHPARRVQG